MSMIDTTSSRCAPGSSCAPCSTRTWIPAADSPASSSASAPSPGGASHTTGPSAAATAAARRRGLPGDVRGQLDNLGNHARRRQGGKLRMPGGAGQHPRSGAKRRPGLPGQQPGRDPRAAQQDRQHAGARPVVDAGDGAPAGRDSVSGAGTTVYCE